MTTAAIYARFSTERQKETSLDDQIYQARRRIEQEGWNLGPIYSDKELSGSMPVALRNGGKAMLAGAIAGDYQILILEGLDRLARNLGEQERIVEQLEYAGIRLVGYSDGYDSTSKTRIITRGMRGIINAVYIDDLREKTHRGLAGQFERGLFAGGISYGYRTIKVKRGHQLRIDTKQAAIVRRIFDEFAGGAPYKSIVAGLNADGIPAPRGGTWTVSAIYGNPGRGTGILNNELYNATDMEPQPLGEKPRHRPSPARRPAAAGMAAPSGAGTAHHTGRHLGCRQTPAAGRRQSPGKIRAPGAPPVQRPVPLPGMPRPDRRYRRPQLRLHQPPEPRHLRRRLPYPAPPHGPQTDRRHPHRRLQPRRYQETARQDPRRHQGPAQRRHRRPAPARDRHLPP
ncbi:MAG: recombinase family protein [Gammaproteobacteria bacterium]|nr:recombinase family protein [Gammaproteobacteria bacterium]